MIAARRASRRCEAAASIHYEDEVSRRKTRKKKENTRKKEKAKWENKKFTGRPHGIPVDYAEELSPLLLLGRRSGTDAGWLGDAGTYCGETGENCDAGVLPS